MPAAPHVHLRRRDGGGEPATDAEREAEAAADRLAFELLAPATGLDGLRDAGEVRRELVERYGLPPGPAAAYAAALRPPEPIDPLVARLAQSF